MSKKIGVSFIRSANSYDAGREMAQTAMRDGGTGNAGLALVFASAEHDSESILRGVKSIIGNECIIAGGTSTGVITNDYLGYEGFQASMLVDPDHSLFLFPVHLIVQEGKVLFAIVLIGSDLLCKCFFSHFNSAL